jgi:hypothetical protein
MNIFFAGKCYFGMLCLAIASNPCGGEETDQRLNQRREELAGVTGFSWDTVPVCAHMGQTSGTLSQAELEWIASAYPIITLEKSHGLEVYGSTEAGIAATARRLKAINPHIKVLFYFNAFINWPPYDALKDFPDRWILRDPQGEMVTNPSGVPRPDVSNPEMQDWWSGVVAENLEAAPLDGLFGDALPQVLSPALNSRLGPEKAEALREGMEQMLAKTKALLGNEKIILVNGIRGDQFREILDWEGIDGVMIEHFDAFHSRDGAVLFEDLKSFEIARKKGKFVILKGWPGFTWLDPIAKERPETELLELARNEITFPLACYLVAANRGDFFSYSWGYRENHGTIDSYEPLNRPLGAPLGEATWSAMRASRDFKHASVTVDLDSREASISWRNDL